MSRKANDDRLIAKFMGEKPIIDGYHAEKYKYVCVIDGPNGHLIRKYHNEWNLLMPVAEKIKEICYTKHLSNQFEPLKESLLDFDLFALWCSIVQFIEWYNENK